MQRIGRDDRRRFREAVALRDRHAGHGLPPLGDLALHGHAAAHADAQRREVDRVEARCVQQSVEQRIDAGHETEPGLPQQRDEALHVARIGDQQVMAAELHEAEQVRRQRVDVVQRQRRHDDAGSRAEERPRPRGGLERVRNHVALREHRALGAARGSARVLQEREIAAREPRRRIGERSAARERVAVGDGAGDVPGTHEPLHVLHDEIHDGALERRAMIAEPRHDDVLHRRAR